MCKKPHLIQLLQPPLALEERCWQVHVWRTPAQLGHICTSKPTIS